MLEAVVLLCQVELAKPKAGPWRFSFTRQQVYDLAHAKHPDLWPAEPSTAELDSMNTLYQRVKDRFTRRRKGGFDEGDPVCQPA